jgi:hypothetical protein
MVDSLHLQGSLQLPVGGQFLTLARGFWEISQVPSYRHNICNNGVVEGIEEDAGECADDEEKPLSNFVSPERFDLDMTMIP